MADRPISILGFHAYGKPLRGYNEPDRRGQLRMTLALDYLKGSPVETIDITFDRALHLQAELAKEIARARTHGLTSTREAEMNRTDRGVGASAPLGGDPHYDR